MLRRAAETTRGRLTLLGATIADRPPRQRPPSPTYAFDEYGELRRRASGRRSSTCSTPPACTTTRARPQRTIGALPGRSPAWSSWSALLFTFDRRGGRATRCERLGQTDRPVTRRGPPADHRRHRPGLGGRPRRRGETPTPESELDRLVVLAPESARDSRAQMLSDTARRPAAGCKFELVFGDTAGDSGFELAAGRDGARDPADALDQRPGRRRGRRRRGDPERAGAARLPERGTTPIADGPPALPPRPQRRRRLGALPAPTGTRSSATAPSRRRPAPGADQAAGAGRSCPAGIPEARAARSPSSPELVDAAWTRRVGARSGACG